MQEIVMFISGCWFSCGFGVAIISVMLYTIALPKPAKNFFKLLACIVIDILGGPISAIVLGYMLAKRLDILEDIIAKDIVSQAFSQVMKEIDKHDERKNTA